MDDWHVGVRVSRPEVADVVARLFAGHLVTDADGTEVPANWSVRIGGFVDGEEDEDETLHLLYRARRLAVRSRRPSRILHALAAHVSALAERPAPGWRTRGVVLVGPAGRAVVASPSLRPQLPRLERLLERRGIAVVDAPDPRVDLDGRQVVIPAPPFTLDPTDAQRVDDRFGDRCDVDRRVTPGVYTLAGWAVVPQHPSVDSTARAVASVVESFDPPPAGSAQALLESVMGAVLDLPVRSLAADSTTTVENLAALTE